MSTDHSIIKAKAQFYLFATHLKNSVKEKNAHKQLYSTLNRLDGDWYQPSKNESRRIQFVQIGDVLACRSTVKPVGVPSMLIEREVKLHENINLKVRLPMMRRDQHKKGTNYIPVKKEHKTKFYTELLERNGMVVDKLLWRGALNETVFFTKKGHSVAIPVDDIKASVKIVDVEKFVNSMLHGIGRCKTYGCGMISIIDKAAA